MSKDFPRMNNSRILVLGGTRFVGRMTVETLLLQNAQPTLFHRSPERNALFPHLEHLNGDRESDDISQVLDRDWDIVIDFSCQYPLTLQAMLQRMRGRVGRYIMISSISAVDMGEMRQAVTVDAPLLECSAEQKIDTNMAAYGPRKAETERVLIEAGPADSVVLRPALMFGPHDWSDRMYYWIDRVRTQDRILMPQNDTEDLTLCFGPDLAAAVVAAAGAPQVDRVYNAVTPPDYSLAEIVSLCEDILQRQVERVHVPAELLAEHEVRPWMDLPLWLNGARLSIDPGNFVRHFLPRPHTHVEAMRAAVNDYAGREWPAPRYGLGKEREAELLEIHAQRL